GCTPVDVAAGDRAAAVPTVLGDGADARRAVAARTASVAVHPLHDWPAEVEAVSRGGRHGSDHAGRHEVDLLVGVLADVADPEIAGGAVEGVAPRVAQAKGPNLGVNVFVEADVRIVRRDGVRGAAIDVEAQHLAKQGHRILGVPIPIAGAATVAGADPELAVWPEEEHAAIVVHGR